MSSKTTMQALDGIVAKLAAQPQAPKPDQTRDRSEHINYFSGRLLNPRAEADRIWARIQARKARQQHFKEAAE